MRVLLTTLLAVLLWASPAHAGLVTGLFSTLGTLFTSSALLKIGFQVFASIGLNLLQQRRAQKKRQTGLQVSRTTTGEIESESSIFGIYATKAHLAYHNSHGKNNRYYQMVMELGGIPGAQLSRFIIEAGYSDLDETEHAEYGKPILSKRVNGTDYAWVRFYDGTQTTADPTLVAKYGDDPDEPWTADHIGTGIPYMIVTYLQNQKVFPNGVPEHRAETQGPPLYDPRKDDTVGGVGPHRWDDPATWTGSRNNVVFIYNVLRGITLPDGTVWGGDADADDLPLSVWIPAMNVCDVDVGGRKQYQFGLEVRFAEDQPADVCEEALAGCNGQIAEFGGFWYIQVGPPEVPVVHITDDDLLVSEETTKEPFPALENIYNGVQVTFTSPGALWNGKPLEPILDANWEVEDGTRRVFDLQLPAVFSPAQGLQLGEDAARDNRRWRQHGLPLPPDYANLRPLQSFTWTSAWNSYDAKAFEISDIAYDLYTLNVTVSCRERDPADFSINPLFEIADIDLSTGPLVVLDAGVPGFGFAATIVSNETGTVQYPGATAVWQSDDIIETVRAIAIEVQVAATQAELWSGTVIDIEREQKTIFPLPRDEDVQARAMALSGNREGIWTPWVTIHTDDIRTPETDLSDALASKINTATARHDQALVDAQGTVSELFAAVVANFGPMAGLSVNPGAPAVQLPVDGTLAGRVEPLIPAQRSVEDTIDDLAQQIGWALGSLQGTDQRLADAGITRDPATGQIRIAAFEFLEQRTSEVSIDLDAAKAAIALRATFAEVNQAIAEAQLDPADLAALNDLELRVSDAELDVDALNGLVALKASTTVVNGIDTRLTTAEADIDSLEGVIVLKVDQAEFNAAETRLTTAEAELSALDGASIRQTVVDTRQAFDELDLATFDTLGAVWKAFEERESLREGLAFAQSQLHAKVDEGLSAEASARLSLAAALTATDAKVAGNATALSGLDTRVTSVEGSLTAQASAITELQSDVGTNAASIASISATKVDAAGAVAAVETAVSASFGSMEAMAEATAFAKAQADGISAGLVWRLNGQNLMEAVSVSDGVSGPVQTFRLAADYVHITGLTQLDTAVLDSLFANNVVTGRLEVTRDLLAPGVITDIIDDYRFDPISQVITVAGGAGSHTFSGNVGDPGTTGFGTIQGLVTAILRGRSTSTSGPGGTAPLGFGGWFRAELRFDGATFMTLRGEIWDGDLQARVTAFRGAGSSVTGWEMQVDVWDIPDGNIEIIGQGFLLAVINF